MNTTALSPNIRLNIVDRGDGSGAFIPSTLINGYSVMSIPAYSRAIRFLSENLASFPRTIHRAGATVDEAKQPHGLDSLLRRRPNEYQNPFILWRTWYMHAAHTGNGYMWIERGAGGRPIGLHNLMPQDVCPFRFWPEGAPTPTQWYLVRSTGQILAGADVLHLQSAGSDGIKGADPVAQHEATFQLAHTLSKFQTMYLKKGTIIRGAIEIPGNVPPERLEQMVTMLRRHFYGTDADRDVIMLTEGAKLNNATVSPQESKIIEQGAVQTKQIAQITGVPPEFLYELSEAKYNASVVQAGESVVRYTFRPWIEQADDELTVKLIDRDEQDAGVSIKINPDALLRGDTKAVNDSVIAQKNSGIRTPNEGRALLGLPRLTDPSADKLSTLGSTAKPSPDEDDPQQSKKNIE
jgi:HK97 family phage portal protein